MASESWVVTKTVHWGTIRKDMRIGNVVMYDPEVDVLTIDGSKCESSNDFKIAKANDWVTPDTVEGRKALSIIESPQIPPSNVINSQQQMNSPTEVSNLGNVRGMAVVPDDSSVVAPIDISHMKADELVDVKRGNGVNVAAKHEYGPNIRGQAASVESRQDIVIESGRATLPDGTVIQNEKQMIDALRGQDRRMPVVKDDGTLARGLGESLNAGQVMTQVVKDTAAIKEALKSTPGESKNVPDVPSIQVEKAEQKVVAKITAEDEALTQSEVPAVPESDEPSLD